MLNLKTGAISLPGMLSNLLYKDIASGLDSYETYSDNSDFGPQTPDSFTVDRDTLDSQIAEIGQEYGKGVYGALQSGVKGLASTWGGAMFGSPTMGSVISNAIDYNAGKVPGNTSTLGKTAESLSKATTTGSLGEIAKSAYGLASMASPMSGYASMAKDLLGIASTTYNMATKAAGFLSDLAGYGEDTQQTGTKQDIANAINNEISSGFAQPGFGGRLATQLDTFGIEDNINVPDISRDSSGSDRGSDRGGDSVGGTSNSDMGNSGLGSGLGTGGSGGGSNDVGGQAEGSPGHGSSGAQGTDSDSDSDGW